MKYANSPFGSITKSSKVLGVTATGKKGQYGTLKAKVTQNGSNSAFQQIRRVKWGLLLNLLEGLSMAFKGFVYKKDPHSSHWSRALGLNYHLVNVVAGAIDDPQNIQFSEGNLVAPTGFVFTSSAAGDTEFDIDTLPQDGVKQMRVIAFNKSTGKWSGYTEAIVNDGDLGGVFQVPNLVVNAGDNIIGYLYYKTASGKAFTSATASESVVAVA